MVVVVVMIWEAMQWKSDETGLALRAAECAVSSSATRGCGGAQFCISTSSLSHWLQAPSWHRPGPLRPVPLASLKYSPPPPPPFVNSPLAILHCWHWSNVPSMGVERNLWSPVQWYNIPWTKKKQTNKKNYATNASATSARQNSCPPRCLWTEFRNGRDSREERSKRGWGGV